MSRLILLWACSVSRRDEYSDLSNVLESGSGIMCREIARD